MKTLVIGGDGFCGWPTSLHLSNLGHDVLILDDLSRRKIDEEMGVNSLTPIQSLEDRCAAWKEVSGRDINYKIFSLGEDYDALLELLKDYQPDNIVHFGEQRSAPYSMKSSGHKRYTVRRNVNATHDLLAALVELDMDVHLVHLGTMGVYGYGVFKDMIPEGYVDITLGGETAKVLYPTSPGSVYHMTKSIDQLLFQFYQKNDKMRVTDLHQGIVWGTQTEETKKDERLVNRFDYDGEYGTVLNRFLMQGVIKHPLTVYGTGGQSRAFIHIQDTVRCVALAISNPPEKGEKVRIINQVTEVHKVRDLAEMISKMTGTEVKKITNPRQELAENELAVSNKTFLNLGLNPICLDEGLLTEITEVAGRYADRCVREAVISTTYWNKDRAKANAEEPAKV